MSSTKQPDMLTAVAARHLCRAGREEEEQRGEKAHTLAIGLGPIPGALGIVVSHLRRWGGPGQGSPDP